VAVIAVGLMLKEVTLAADAAIVEESTEFLFQDRDDCYVREVMARGYWTDNFTGREYVVVSVAEGRGDPHQPGVKQWVVRGYPKQDA
jgi:hypothetical protein